jgi:hypothetical protein
VAGGLGGFLTSPAGGMLADWASRRWSSHPNGRLLAGAPITLVLLPFGCLMYAWSLQLKRHLVVVLICESSPPAGSLIAGTPRSIVPLAAGLLWLITRDQTPSPRSPRSPTATFMLGAGLALIMPATFSMVSIHKQRFAAAASGGMSSLMFLFSGFFVLVSRWLQDTGAEEVAR